MFRSEVTSESIATELNRDVDSVEYVEIARLRARYVGDGSKVKLVEQRVRMEIQAGCNVSKAYAKVSVWASGNWKPIHSLSKERIASLGHFPESRDASIQSRLATAEIFADDVKELKRIAAAVLFD